MLKPLYFIIASIGLLLPHRARLFYASAIAMVIQAIYFSYFKFFHFIISQVTNKERPKDSND